MTYARNHALGRYGERIACAHLESIGWAILDRNWTCRYGELDIVAQDGATLAVCEVKTRSESTFGTPLEAVSSAKAARLRRLVSHWLEVHDEQPRAVRIDVIGVCLPRRGAARIEQIRGVA